MEKVNFDDYEFYVSETKKNKENITAYTSYIVKGKQILEGITRRYREFDCLRKKLIERWPGIFIPQLPHKTAVGKTKQDVVEFRVEQINRFCLKIGKIPYLFNGKEIQTFISNTPDVTKSLNSLQPETYEDIKNKYISAFPNFDTQFNPDSVRAEHERFFGLLKVLLPKLEEFRKQAKEMKKNFTKHNEAYTNILSLLEEYETNTLIDYSNNNKKELVLGNPFNKELIQEKGSIKEGKSITNPYEKLYDKLTEDVLDFEALLEAYNTCLEVQIKKSKIGAKGGSPSEQEALGTIIKISVYELEMKIKKYKETSLTSYYSELWKIKQATEENCNNLNGLFDLILNDKNISPENK